MLHLGSGIPNVDVGESVSTALIPDQKGIALGIIPGILSPGHDLDTAPVGVLALAGRDSFRDNGAARIFP